MIVSPGPASFSARSLAVLRSVGAWMTIAPEKTYVATSIRGLGLCKSTYCKAERREPPARPVAPGGGLAALFAISVAVAASGLLSGFAAHRPGDARDMAEPDQPGSTIADCQKSAAPVSSGLAAGVVVAATRDCGSASGVAVAASGSAADTADAEASPALARAGVAGRVGFAGG